MRSKKEPRNLHRKKTEQRLSLAGHYGQIGIKAVAAATQKGSGVPQELSGDDNSNEGNNTEGEHDD